MTNYGCHSVWNVGIALYVLLLVSRNLFLQRTMHHFDNAKSAFYAFYLAKLDMDELLLFLQNIRSPACANFTPILNTTTIRLTYWSTVSQALGEHRKLSLPKVSCG